MSDKRESALEWLCRNEGYVTILHSDPDTYMVVASGLIPSQGSCRFGEVGRAYGDTLALAIIACAKAAGWAEKPCAANGSGRRFSPRR